ncbi:hypothetical protein Cyrtocomes_01180 [Candidatus Cyrtobacter comes]|uniref:Uncharacterized protein n=1 Tax=Candidatus Cyrtobacter comes TaxID=675776 RepID=A0ABU5LA26_9RICK|nr:hypothetical protein [Candidatus Cyrtobacter comes]MDZ5762785.1 hypothetical protein [Candidatus Cyrtobacter comes]
MSTKQFCSLIFKKINENYSSHSTEVEKMISRVMEEYMSIEIEDDSSILYFQVRYLDSFNKLLSYTKSNLGAMDAIVTKMYNKGQGDNFVSSIYASLQNLSGNQHLLFSYSDLEEKDNLEYYREFDDSFIGLNTKSYFMHTYSDMLDNVEDITLCNIPSLLYLLDGNLIHSVDDYSAVQQEQCYCYLF